MWLHFLLRLHMNEIFSIKFRFGPMDGEAATDRRGSCRPTGSAELSRINLHFIQLRLIFEAETDKKCCRLHSLSGKSDCVHVFENIFISEIFMSKYLLFKFGTQKIAYFFSSILPYVPPLSYFFICFKTKIKQKYSWL